MASANITFHKKMNALRIEADENQAKVEELQARVKSLEQEHLQKEQEITSLTHRNGLLESEVEKLESGIKDAKAISADSSQHATQNEALTRRLQLLEDEAEEADKTLRETNEKWVTLLAPLHHTDYVVPDFVKQTSRRDTTSARSRHWRHREISGNLNMRRWPRSTQTCRKSSRSSRSAWATSNGRSSSHPLISVRNTSFAFLSSCCHATWKVALSSSRSKQLMAGNAAAGSPR